jgi:hypothetical protein
MLAARVKNMEMSREENPIPRLPPPENEHDDLSFSDLSLSLTCHEDICPPGLFCKDGRCACGAAYPHHIVTCQDARASLQKFYCATFDREMNTTQVGRCLSSLFNGTAAGSRTGDLFNQFPEDVHELTEKMCSPRQRTGTLCGRCLPDHYPLAYTYNMTCIRCPNVRWNWVRYIMAAYLPLTCFCLVILLFSVNVTSSHLTAMVYFCQLLTMPLQMRLYVSFKDGTVSRSGMEAVVSLYAIWSLDYFRNFYSDICLGIGVLPIMALEYVIAMYPFIFVIVSYLLVHLYDREYRILVALWKPFRALITLFRSNWDAKTSLIDAFATFFFLSSMKFFSASLDLLTPVWVYHLHPDDYTSTIRLWNSADIAYFGKAHLPYAILAIVVLCVFVLLPIIFLILYPLRSFQKFLNLFHCRWHVLHTFTDSFQGCYKNGTEPGTRDYRWFASVFFIFRLNVLCIPLFQNEVLIGSTVGISVIALQTTLTAFSQPYKSSVSHYNLINIIFLLFSTLLCIFILGLLLSLMMSPQSTRFFSITVQVCCLAPLLYAIAIFCYWVYAHRKFGSDILVRFKAWKSGYMPLAESANASLPDRLQNSHRYSRRNLTRFSQ